MGKARSKLGGDPGGPGDSHHVTLVELRLGEYKLMFVIRVD